MNIELLKKLKQLHDEHSEGDNDNKSTDTMIIELLTTLCEDMQEQKGHSHYIKCDSYDY